MFEKLFAYPGVVSRHLDAPLAEERQQYLQYRGDQGTPQSTLLHLASELLGIAQHLPLGKGSVGATEIARAALRWAQHQQQCGRAKTLEWPQRCFVQTATQWLRFLDRFQEPVLSPPAYAQPLADFVSALQHQQNLADATVTNYRWHAEKFLGWWDVSKRDLAQVQLRDVDAYLAQLGTQGWERISVASAATCLRAFFRHAQGRVGCASGIASGIEGPRIFQQENIPGGPPWPEVQRLLAHLQTDQPKDIRNYAIALLVAGYGLRSGEVRRWRLDDVDWPEGRFRIAHSKSGRVQEYPLMPQMGQALIRYLQEVRPRCEHREVFLTLHAPFRPLSTGALRQLFANLFERLGIRSPKQGPHAVRHAWATHMLAQGLGLAEIGGLLGHRQVATTRIYAKVDLVGLREVADFALEGLL
jgi:integrase/recombinase XerD